MINIQDLIPLVVTFRDLKVRMWFGIVQILAANFLLGTAYIGKCTRVIIAMKRKVVPEHSPPKSLIVAATETKLMSILLFVIGECLKMWLKAIQLTLSVLLRVTASVYSSLNKFAGERTRPKRKLIQVR